MCVFVKGKKERHTEKEREYEIKYEKSNFVYIYKKQKNHWIKQKPQNK